MGIFNILPIRLIVHKENVILLKICGILNNLVFKLRINITVVERNFFNIFL